MSCGTYGGAQVHARNGEQVCPDCRDARNEYMRDYRSRHPDTYRRNLARARARERALRRLGELYPADLRRLIREEATT